MTSYLINKDDYYISNNKVIYYFNKFDPEKHLKINSLSIDDFKKQQKYNIYSVLLSNTVADNKNKYDPTPYIFIPPEKLNNFCNIKKLYNPIDFKNCKLNIKNFYNNYKIFVEIYNKVNKFILFHYTDIFKDKSFIDKHYFNNAVYVTGIINSLNIRNIHLNPKCSFKDFSNQDIFKIINNHIVKCNVKTKNDLNCSYKVYYSFILNLNKIWLTKPCQIANILYNQVNNINEANELISYFFENFITFFGWKPFIQQIFIDERPMIPNQKIHFIHKNALVNTTLFDNTFNYNIYPIRELDLNMYIHNKKSFINIHKNLIYLHKNKINNKCLGSRYLKFFDIQYLFFKSFPKYMNINKYVEIDFDNNIIIKTMPKISKNLEIIKLDDLIKSLTTTLTIPIKKDFVEKVNDNLQNTENNKSVSENNKSASNNYSKNKINNEITDKINYEYNEEIKLIEGLSYYNEENIINPTVPFKHNNIVIDEENEID